MLGPNSVRQGDVTELHQLRARIRRGFEASDETAAIAELNGLLAGAGVTPWIARTPAGREIFFAPPDAPLARRVTCDAGLGLAMMMADQCSGRVNVAAFRSRKRAGPTAPAAR